MCLINCGFGHFASVSLLWNALQLKTYLLYTKNTTNNFILSSSFHFHCPVLVSETRTLAILIDHQPLYFFHFYCSTAFAIIRNFWFRFSQTISNAVSSHLLLSTICNFNLIGIEGKCMHWDLKEIGSHILLFVSMFICVIAKVHISKIWVQHAFLLRLGQHLLIRWPVSAVLLLPLFRSAYFVNCKSMLLNSNDRISSFVVISMH